jgi:oxalate decarboxylase/phosphoglucose isomerase-like protein (cupin superfamily)
MTEDCPDVIRFEKDHAAAVLDIDPPERGTVFRVLEVMPGKEAYMHVTQTIDYAMVLDGQATMLLDDSEVVLEQGDVLVQRATNHGWTNRSDKPCRIAFVLIGAQPA